MTLYKECFPTRDPPTTNTDNSSWNNLHINPGHLPAVISSLNQQNFTITESDRTINEDVYRFKYSRLLSSTLSSAYTGPTMESSCNRLVRSLVGDVLCAQKWDSLAFLLPEVTLSRLQADLYVIMKRDGSLAGFIKVKIPAITDTQREMLFPLDSRSELGGELYLALLRNAGVDKPVGMLHTFNQCMVVWSPNGLPELGGSKSDRTDDCSMTFSCTQSSRHSSACEIFDGRSDGEAKLRKLYASQVFDSGNDVLHPTTAAIRYMIASNCKRKLSGAPQHGTKVGGRVMPKVSEKGVKNVKGPLVNIEYRKNLSSKNALYLVQRVGRGSNAVCYIAVDDVGCGGAFKLYIDIGQYNYGAETEHRANQEVKLWKTVNDLETRTFKVQIDEDPAYGLLMPYCRPLSQNERKDRLGEVERALRLLAEAGYYYETYDVRWRHFTVVVSEDPNGRLVLLDMDEVHELETKDPSSIELLVQDQLKVLKSSMNDL